MCTCMPKTLKRGSNRREGIVGDPVPWECFLTLLSFSLSMSLSLANKEKKKSFVKQYITLSEDETF